MVNQKNYANVYVGSGCNSNGLIYRESELFLPNANSPNLLKLNSTDLSIISLNYLSKDHNLYFEPTILTFYENYLIASVDTFNHYWIAQLPIKNSTIFNQTTNKEYVRSTVYNPFKLELYSFV